MLVLLADDHFDELQARRHVWGADKLDEVWTGIPHLSQVDRHSRLQQAIALLLHRAARERGLVAVLGAYEPSKPDPHGSPSDAPRLRGDQASTAALAVEIVTCGDDVAERLRSLAADRVGEVVVVDPDRRTVDWLALADNEYQPIEMSRLIDHGPKRLAEMIEWSAPGRER